MAMEMSHKINLSPPQKRMIDKIKDIFIDYPFEYDDEISRQLSEIYKQLDCKQKNKSGADIINSEIACCIKNMDCFTHRAHIIDDKQIRYWNPIEQKFKEFAQNSLGSNINCYQASFEHPAPDIIYNWAMYELRT